MGHRRSHAAVGCDDNLKRKNPGCQLLEGGVAVRGQEAANASYPAHDTTGECVMSARAPANRSTRYAEYDAQTSRRLDQLDATLDDTRQAMRATRSALARRHSPALARAYSDLLVAYVEIDQERHALAC